MYLKTLFIFMLLGASLPASTPLKALESSSLSMSESNSEEVFFSTIADWSKKGLSFLYQGANTLSKSFAKLIGEENLNAGLKYLSDSVFSSLSSAAIGFIIGEVASNYVGVSGTLPGFALDAFVAKIANDLSEKYAVPKLSEKAFGQLKNAVIYWLSQANNLSLENNTSASSSSQSLEP